VVLLRASSEALGAQADLEATLGRGDGGVEHGELMARFAEASTRGNDDLDALRRQALEVLGPERFVEVAATVGIFNGLVRVADATGIPLDHGTRKVSSELRAHLGLNAFAGARNSDRAHDGVDTLESEVSKLFS